MLKYYYFIYSHQNHLHNNFHRHKISCIQINVQAIVWEIYDAVGNFGQFTPLRKVQLLHELT